MIHNNYNLLQGNGIFIINTYYSYPGNMRLNQQDHHVCLNQSDFLFILIYAFNCKFWLFYFLFCNPLYFKHVTSFGQLELCISAHDQLCFEKRMTIQNFSFFALISKHSDNETGEITLKHKHLKQQFKTKYINSICDK